MRQFIPVLVALLLSSPALACPGPAAERYHYPSCEIPLPEPQDRVVLIETPHRGQLSPYHLGDPQRRTLIHDVTIAPNDHRNYIVLPMSEQAIWRFSGDTNSISRVIALGSYFVGPSGMGVVGIPADRVAFTTPDLSLMRGFEANSCTWISRACLPRQWFGEEPGEAFTFHPPPAQPRQRVDVVISSRTARRNTDEPIRVTMPETRDAVVSIDPADVVSLTPPAPYDLLPGQAGLDALVASGALVPAGTDLHRETVAAWADAFSYLYRSRFDPDFHFSPHVDYIVTRAATLPPRLPPTRFLLAAGVPEPAFSGPIHYDTCLYALDRADTRSATRNVFSNWCRQRPPSGNDQAILRAAVAFDTSGTGEVCHLPALPTDTHIAVVALSEEEHHRHRDDPIREIEVRVTRAGPVALYLSMEGGPVRWQVTGSAVAEIYMAREPEWSMDEVILNGAPYAQTRLGIDREGCPYFAPYSPSRLGPAIAHLDQMVELLLGQPIDRLITHIGTGEGWNAADQPTPVFTVE